MTITVHRVDPADDAALAACAAVLAASDRDLWPDRTGFTLHDFEAFARFEGSTRRFELLAASEGASTGVLGIGLMELSLRDNVHAVEVTVAVHPDHRRRGVGTAIVEELGAQARRDGRRTLNSLVDVPVAQAGTHASLSFAPRVGFESTLPGNSRHLGLPPDADRLDALRGVVATARDAADYRLLTFESPWPEEFMDDQCALLRVMSTDEPAGDSEHEEEVWDAVRIAENEALRAARDTTKLTTVAQHVPSGRLVALTEILLAADTPDEAWQLVTVVDPRHRGHRLGLAVKLANLDALGRRAPAVRLLVTGNAQVNAPMIAINDMLGFEIAGEGRFWQKHLVPS